MIIGSNSAENHPLSFKWIQKAKERGAKLISVDPRYTRSSSLSDIYCRLRSGTDIAFVGGIINYVLQNNLIHEEYVKNYTNATYIINDEYYFDDGVFAGLENGSYNKSKWRYKTDANGVIVKDNTMQDPNCVYQIMKRHYERYTVEDVCATTGADPETYKQICELYASSAQKDENGNYRSATIMYAMGTTQHTHGTQNIRSYAILQLLLGNIGVAGGGINALRGESNVQGSTDMALLFHIIPGYLGTPNATQQSLATYNQRFPSTNEPNSANWWSNGPKYMTSLLKAFYGPNATSDNDFGYHYLPKIDPKVNYSHISLFEEMYKGNIEGLFLFGQNPAVGGPNANFEREAMKKLKWMVAVDIWPTDTSEFWKACTANEPLGQETDITEEELARQLETEVFRLPAAASMEKEGSVTNSGRWCQWRYQMSTPPGDARDDNWIINAIFKKVRELYENEGGAYPDPITKSFWSYKEEHGGHLNPHEVAKEINGYAMEDIFDGDGNLLFAKGEQLPSFTKLTDDGKTCSGNWLYCGGYVGEGPTADKGNKYAKRQRSNPEEDPIGLHPNWSWCWPVNRRIIYNRASVDLNGVPWDKEHYVIKWNADTRKWEGDVPDGGWPPMNEEGTRKPFIMKPEGVARIFGMGAADGPLPEHYEPMESPLQYGHAFSSQKNTPAVYIYKGESENFASPENYPIVATTYRVTEHWQAGAMTRSLPWLVELVPDLFIEMSYELAQEKDIKHGDIVEIYNDRGRIRAYALLTHRFKPFHLKTKRPDGQFVEQVVHEIGIPWHWGFVGRATGCSANCLTPHVGDCNTRIPEFKAFLVDVRKWEGG